MKIQGHSFKSYYIFQEGDSGALKESGPFQSQELEWPKGSPTHEAGPNEDIFIDLGGSVPPKSLGDQKPSEKQVVWHSSR